MEDVETRPSRLVAQLAGTPQAIAGWSLPHRRLLSRLRWRSRTRAACRFRLRDVGGRIDRVDVPVAVPVQGVCHGAPGSAGMGTGASRADARAARKAVACSSQVRLGRPAERHSHPGELTALADLRRIRRDACARRSGERLPAGARERMPRRYLELEEMRLIPLVTEWLEFERARAPFIVAATEYKMRPLHRRARAPPAHGPH